MDTLRLDLAYALRRLRRSPGFTAVAALTVAVGVGAATTVFSVANGLLLRVPEGVRDPGSLVNLHRTAPDGSSYHAFSHPDYLDLRRADSGLAELVAYSTFAASLLRTDEPELLGGLLVSDNYFAALGTRPAVGRLLIPGDRDVLVLGHRTWSERFGADPAVVGQAVTLNGRPFTVAGVAEPGFEGHLAVLRTGVWVPAAAQPEVTEGDLLDQRGSVWLESFGRLAPGTGRDEVQSRMDAAAAALAERFPEEAGGEGIDVRPYTALWGGVYGGVAAFMGLLLGIAVLVLLIACVNVAGMLLAHGAARGREIAVRMALGGRRGRIVRQLLAESLILFVLGGAGGALLAFLGTAAAARLRPPVPIPIGFDFLPDLRVLGFALAVTLATALSFGLMPALRASRRDLVPALRRGPGGGGGRSRLRDGLVIAQVAGSAVVLVVAGLFVRALGRAADADPGFDPHGVEVMELDLAVNHYAEPEGRAFYNQLVRRVAALPGVTSAGLVHILPLNLSNAETAIRLEGESPDDERAWHPVDATKVSPGYFETLRIPIVRGLGFDPTLGEGEPRVAILNQTAAERLWPGESPLGRRIHVGGGAGEETGLTVIGIARDAKYRLLDEPPRSMLYLPFGQSYQPRMTLVVRTAAGTTASGGVRTVLRELDPSLAYLDRGPMPEVIAVSLLPQRVAAAVAGGFGALGLLLGGVGLYGVLAYQVVRRTREIGVRIALGARRGQIARRVLGRGLRLTAIGLGVGFAAAWGVGKLIARLLYGVGAADPPTLAAIAVILTAAALLAGYLPARRAQRIDPMTALRHE